MTKEKIELYTMIKDLAEVIRNMPPRTRPGTKPINETWKEARKRLTREMKKTE